MSTDLKESLVLEEIPVPGYERVVKITDLDSGLIAIICLHNLSLGPALGGTRIYPYATFEEALTDAKRLARGMTYKSAIIEAGLGGGKSVIIADAKTQKSEAKLLAFGQAVERLEGSYICAEDYGCTPKDALVIRQKTRYIVGLPMEKSSGDPGSFTAHGTLKGIQTALKKVYGSDSCEGKTIAIQGLGSVGSRLAELLFWEGARLIISDIDQTKARDIGRACQAEVVSPGEILSASCDLLAPCALGGILNAETIPQLRCRAIAGCANNQLLTDADGEELMRHGILYAPDFVINAGGLINVAEELHCEGYSPIRSRNKVNKIYDQLMLIYEIAEKNQISTHAAALSLGDYRLKYGVGRRTTPLHFHH